MFQKRDRIKRLEKYIEKEAVRALCGTLMHYIVEAPGELTAFTDWIIEGLEPDFEDVSVYITPLVMRERISKAHDLIAADCDTSIEQY